MGLSRKPKVAIDPATAHAAICSPVRRAVRERLIGRSLTVLVMLVVAHVESVRWTDVVRGSVSASPLLMTAEVSTHASSVAGSSTSALRFLFREE